MCQTRPSSSSTWRRSTTRLISPASATSLRRLIMSAKSTSTQVSAKRSPSEQVERRKTAIRSKHLDIDGDVEERQHLFQHLPRYARDNDVAVHFPRILAPGDRGGEIDTSPRNSSLITANADGANCVNKFANVRVMRPLNNKLRFKELPLFQKLPHLEYEKPSWKAERHGLHPNSHGGRVLAGLDTVVALENEKCGFDRPLPWHLQDGLSPSRAVCQGRGDVSRGAESYDIDKPAFTTAMPYMEDEVNDFGVEKSYLAEAAELDHVLSMTEREDRNWLSASADVDDSESDEELGQFGASVSPVDSRGCVRRRSTLVRTEVEVHPPPRACRQSTSSLEGHPRAPANTPLFDRENAADREGDEDDEDEDEDVDVDVGDPHVDHLSPLLLSPPSHKAMSERKQASRLSISSTTGPSPTVSVNSSYDEDGGSILGPEKEQVSADEAKVFGERIRGIVTQFRSRAGNVKRRLEHPPSPEYNSEVDENEEDALAKNRALRKLVFENFDAALYASQSTLNEQQGWRRRLQFIDPRGYVNIAWLCLQALIFLYNAWVIPVRFVFPGFHTDRHLTTWLFCDYLGDLLILFDLLVYKHHVLYMENGFWVKSRRRISRHYVQEGTFIYDMLSLLPLDLLYLTFGVNCTILRVPRLLKVFDFWEFVYRLDSVLAKPYFLRICKTVNYMLYLIHVNACAYYAISEWEGLNSNTFVYDGVGNAYIRCFYFATKTATSIGKNKKPTNTAEIVFMTGSWLLGVFVFAILIGDIRDIVSNARRNEIEFHHEIDAVSDYMARNKVNKDVQRRVKMWLRYTWEQHKSLDETKMLEFLSPKMRTDIAMRVHYNTLVKVKLFRNCEPGLLKDLVVLLRPIIYMPGDYICHKNDVGKEMFIIQSGHVQVIGGIHNRSVLCQLGEGSVFGEIALLGVGGMNKRTADVVSVGFSNLFVLRKDDLETVLKDYPDAKRILNARAKKLMKENAARLQREHEEILRQRDRLSNCTSEVVLFPLDEYRPRQRDPALLSTVIKVLPPASKAVKFLRPGQTANAFANYSLPGSRTPSGGANPRGRRHQHRRLQAQSLSLSQDDIQLEATRKRRNRSGFASFLSPAVASFLTAKFLRSSNVRDALAADFDDEDKDEDEDEDVEDLSLRTLRSMGGRAGSHDRISPDSAALRVTEC